MKNELLCSNFDLIKEKSERDELNCVVFLASNVASQRDKLDSVFYLIIWRKVLV